LFRYYFRLAGSVTRLLVGSIEVTTANPCQLISKNKGECHQLFAFSVALRFSKRGFAFSAILSPIRRLKLSAKFLG